MKRMYSLFVLPAFFLAVLFSACSNEQLTSTDDNIGSGEEISLDKAYGGYSTNDEEMAFGDQELLTDFPEDEVVDDGLSDEPQTVVALNSSTVKAYFLRITWGFLEGDSTATEVVDWSGSAEINKGTLALLRTIRFEGNDFIVRPRDSRQKIEFSSFTKPHFDGIAIAIIDNDTSMADVAGTLTLNIGSYSNVLNFSDLDSLDLVETVDAAGHEVAIVSRLREVEPFSGGFLAGRWVKTEANGGRFKGRWINLLGTNAGHLRGIWGINRQGEKVFFGKYINMNGRFGGLLAGNWESNGDGNGGSFRGRWVNRSLTKVGVLKGRFKTGRAGDRRGFFHGRWETVNDSTD